VQSYIAEPTGHCPRVRCPGACYGPWLLGFSTNRSLYAGRAKNRTAIWCHHTRKEYL